MMHTTITSPIGRLLLVGNDRVLRGLYMLDGPKPLAVDPASTENAAAFSAVIAQLEQFFAGERTVFELEVELEGTPFQQRVWNALREIPYGQTISYGELARRIDRPSAVRAVGLANGRNPVSVIVPCHRVIGANGTLTGYGGGVERKRLLLDLESRAATPRLLDLG
ncbi:MAG: methylated-DNA--[protein]-cysteine S-methyltransferase [Patulibacter sp.]|nr:methylated-DNA--[protein]-cysteine S-methyltransferase [Patulibacter sp.]